MSDWSMIELIAVGMFVLVGFMAFLAIGGLAGILIFAFVLAMGLWHT